MNILKHFSSLFLMLLIASCTNSIKLSKSDLIENINNKQNCYPNCKNNYKWITFNDSTIKLSEHRRGTITFYDSNNNKLGTIYTKDITHKNDKIEGYYSNILKLKKDFIIDSISYGVVRQEAYKKEILLSLIIVILTFPIAFIGMRYIGSN